MFHRDYMDYHRDRFEDHSLMFYDEDKLVALLPLNIKESVLYSHGGLTFGGFITNVKMRSVTMLECFDILKDYMRKHNIKHLIYKALPHIYHDYFAEEDLYALFRNNANILKFEPSVTIDLQNPVPFSKGRKAQISRARKMGVQVVESKDFTNFFKLENEVLSKRHSVTAVHTVSEMELLHSYFPENIKLFAGIFEDKFIAGALVYVYNHVVHTQYLAANDLACDIGALDLTLSTLIDKYKSSKRYFDFGISTEDGGRFLNEGLIQQKETFGGRTTVHQTFDLMVE